MPESEMPLNRDLIDNVMRYLGVSAGRQPDLALLDDLVAAYVRRVPWESVSRIAKKARVVEQTGSADVQACARWPAEFWMSAMGQSTGGTCFESNYAFFALLTALGFSGHLTVNNMDPTVGCHAAIVVTLDGRPWLTDVGLPLYVPLPLNPAQVTYRQSPFHRYTIRPLGSHDYRIERDHHPQTYCFTLIDRPVADPAYRDVLAGDYGPAGLFLDRVIVSKVVDGRICRFNGDEQPYVLERFELDQADRNRLGDDPAGEVGRFFNLDEGLLRQALQVVGIDSQRSDAGVDSSQSHAEEE
ncbi:MAG: arylamine N-acetyltransferase [Chloroflexota bacterium]|nr:MAG: arylamine N-acetyltransferase [Chloroflexota bacterium]